MFTAKSCCCSCTVYRYITATDNNYIARHLLCLIFCCPMEKINCDFNIFCVTSRNRRYFTILTSDCYIECLISIFAEFLNRNILTNLYSTFDLYAEISQNINLSLNDVFFQFVRWIPYVIIPPGLAFFSNTVGLYPI